MDVGEENHRRFKKHLLDSTADVFLVAHYLHCQGFDVEIPALKIASATSEIDRNQDRGDLFINHNGKRLIVEVKSTNTSDFTDTTPHKYSTFFVCAKHAFDKYERDKPSYYFILNKSRTFVAIINVPETYDFWRLIKTSDRRYISYVQERYACPTNLVKIQKLS